MQFGASRRSVVVRAFHTECMSWTDVLTTHEFWTGVPSGAIIGLAAPIIAARRSRNSDQFKADHEVKMDAAKAEREELKSSRQILRESANEFSAVCSSVFEKAIDSKGVFNTVMDFVQNMNEIPDVKAMDKLEYAVDLMDDAKRITTAYNHLRVVAPVAVLEKASALNAAMLALCKATTVPLAKPPLMFEAGKAMEDFTNAVRAELGLDPFTAEDAGRVGKTYMEALTKQMNDYIKETKDEARRLGFLEPGDIEPTVVEPGGIPITTIKAGDLTKDHIGQFVGCHDPHSGFNYGAKIANIIRKDDGPNPGILLWLKHPAMPGGKAGHDDRSRLPFDHEVQLLEMPAGYRGVPQ